MQAVIVKQIPHDSNFHHVYQLDQGNEIDVIYFKSYYYYFFFLNISNPITSLKYIYIYI